MAEVVIALLGLTVLFFGVFQIARTGRASIVNVQEARAEAELAAISADQISQTSSYIADWTDGPDALPYTQDDVMVSAFAGGALGQNSIEIFRNELESPLSLSAMSANPSIPMQSSVPVLLSNDSLALAADMYREDARTSVPFERVLRTLLFAGDGLETLELEDRAVMPGLRLDGGQP